MATYKSTVEAYGDCVKSSAEWQKYFHDEMHIGYKSAADLWKQKLAAGEFVIVGGVAKKPVAKKAIVKKATIPMTKENLNVKTLKKYSVTDAADPHKYELVKEDFNTESERDAKIAEIKNDERLTYVSRCWEGNKFNVTYWKQID